MRILFQNLIQSIQLFIMFKLLNTKCENRIDIHEFREGVDNLIEFGWNPFPPKNINIQIPKIGDKVIDETLDDNHSAEMDYEQ